MSVDVIIKGESFYKCTDCYSDLIKCVEEQAPSPKPWKRWTPKEVKIICKYWKTETDKELMTRLPNRTLISIARKRHSLELKKVVTTRIGYDTAEKRVYKGIVKLQKQGGFL